MTAASNSEARKPTAPEPTGTLEGAPGADSEALSALLGLHRRPAEALTVFGEAWMVCGCGERIDIPVRDGRVSQREVLELHEAHAAAAALASSWLADHDRQIAERAGRDGVRTLGHKVIRLAQANAVLARANPSGSERLWLDLIHVLEADLARFDDPYSEEARRG